MFFKNQGHNVFGAQGPLATLSLYQLWFHSILLPPSGSFNSKKFKVFSTLVGGSVKSNS